jgi:hypothetical protein
MFFGLGMKFKDDISIVLNFSSAEKVAKRTNETNVHPQKLSRGTKRILYKKRIVLFSNSRKCTHKFKFPKLS